MVVGVFCSLLAIGFKMPRLAAADSPTADEIVAEALANSTAESLTIALEGCRKILKDFDAYNLAPENQGKRRVEYGFALIPKWHDGSPETVPVFWWKRKMLRPEDNTHVYSRA